MQWCNHKFLLATLSIIKPGWFLNSWFSFEFGSFWMLMENNICDTVRNISHAQEICLNCQFMLNNYVEHVGHHQISNQTKIKAHDIFITKYKWWWVQLKTKNAYFWIFCVTFLYQNYKLRAGCFPSASSVRAGYLNIFWINCEQLSQMLNEYSASAKLTRFMFS